MNPKLYKSHAKIQAKTYYFKFTWGFPLHVSRHGLTTQNLPLFPCEWWPIHLPNLSKYTDPFLREDFIILTESTSRSERLNFQYINTSRSLYLYQQMNMKHTLTSAGFLVCFVLMGASSAASYGAALSHVSTINAFVITNGGFCYVQIS